MKKLEWSAAALLILVVGFAGCQQDQSNEAAKDPAENAAKGDGSKFVLAAEPAGAKEIIAVRKAAKDGEDVVIVGRIGGDSNPWVEGSAAFSVVDSSLKPCNEIPGDTCKKPWDYCCEPSKTLANSSALVKVVDESGKVVKTDARELLKVKELTTVVVTGKAQRDDAGNLTVLATGVYIKK